jgi:hypothetical protein
VGVTAARYEKPTDAMIDVAAPAPAIVTQAAQRTQTTERGVVTVRVHRVFDVHAGPYSRHDDMVFSAAYQDGTLVKMHIISQQVGGKDTDAATKAETERKYEHPAPGDVFQRPYDPRHLSEYTYEVAGPQTVRFKTLVRDAGHGDGTFTVDSNYNVVSVQYSPAALPQHASSGTVTDTREQVLPGYWAVTREVQEYRGHYAIFGGGATATITQSGFTKYPNVAAAIAALNAPSL